MLIRAISSAVLAMIAIAQPAWSRDTDYLLPVREDMQSGMGQVKLLDVPVFFAGQELPPVARKLGEWKTNKHTRGLFRSDRDSCRVAFLSAVIQLQRRAVREGADAVIGIESITRYKPHSSPTEYRCVAGTTVVHVGLKGTLVQLEK